MDLGAVGNMMPDRSKTPRVDLTILPIFAKLQPKTELLSFEGTGCLVANGLLLTCWHCVASDPGPDQVYMVLINEHDVFKTRELTDISQSGNSDLATARVDLSPSFRPALSSRSPSYGVEVWTFGYPFTTGEAAEGYELMFELQQRHLRGYVTRPFIFRHRTYGEVPSYELDMFVPSGLSGAPLLLRQSDELVGVVYGSHDVAKIEESATVDPDSGERTPEVQRIVSFGLAHQLKTLRSVSGTATGGRRLDELVVAHTRPNPGVSRP